MLENGEFAAFEKESEMMESTCPCFLTGITFLILWVGCVLAAAYVCLRMKRISSVKVGAEQEKTNALFDASACALVVLNERLEIVKMNRAAEAIGFQGVESLARLDGAARLPDEEHAREEREENVGTAARLQPVCDIAKSILSENRPAQKQDVSIINTRGGGVRTAWFRVSGAPVLLRGCRHAVLSLEDVTEDRLKTEKMEDAKVEIERLSAEIRWANAAKGQYFAGKSHEIRTPLNGIIGMADLLMGTAMSDRQREYAQNIRNSSEALLVVMNDILDITKIEGNKIVLEDEAFDLQYCIEEAIRLVMPQAVKKRIEIVYQVDEALQSVWVGDIGRLRQILIYLLDNAIKFTERGEVIVSVSGCPADGDTYRLDFAVKDTGIGIPPERQATLFHSFSQDASPTVARPFGGSGLGLAISKRLCELMGGAMTVESTGLPGHGSVFRFSVMVKASADMRKPADRGWQKIVAGKRVLIVDDNAASRDQLGRMLEAWSMHPTLVASASGALDWLHGDAPFDVAIVDYEMPSMNGLKLAEAIRKMQNRESLHVLLLSALGDRVTGGDRTWIDACVTKPASPGRLRDALVNALSAPVTHTDAAVPLPPADREQAERHPLRILIAEDNVVNQKVAVNLLEKFGYQADVVSDGCEAVDAVKNKRYDVILMDIQMPTLDGEQATIRIRRELPAHEQPWIVAMTANVMKGDRERYLADGMNDYVPKPIRAEQLRVALQGVMRLPE